MTRDIVVLIGSPKPIKRSASARLAAGLLTRLEAEGKTVQWIHLGEAVRSPEKTREMLGAIDEAALVLLSAPLYVDSLPSPTIEALEKIALHRASDGDRRPGFVSTLQCGFVEPKLNQVAERICRAFAYEGRFEKRGRVLLDMTGEAATKRVGGALGQAAEALAQ